jgi:hypothetical protein
MKVIIDAEMPDALLRDWMVHISAFNTEHPECTFTVMVQTGPHITVAKAIEELDASGLKVVGALRFNPDKP